MTTTETKFDSFHQSNISIINLFAVTLVISNYPFDVYVTNQNNFTMRCLQFPYHLYHFQTITKRTTLLHILAYMQMWFVYIYNRIIINI